MAEETAALRDGKQAEVAVPTVAEPNRDQVHPENPVGKFTLGPGMTVQGGVRGQNPSILPPPRQNL